MSGIVSWIVDRVTRTVIYSGRMIRSSHHKPVYREVISSALKVAWEDRPYWILALLACLLASAGSFDILQHATSTITAQGKFLAFSAGGAIVSGILATQTIGLDRILVAATGVEVLAVMALFFLMIGVASCIAQGGLVFALGARKRGERPSVGEAFRVGARALWPIIVLNIMVFSVIWVLRFVVSLPLSMALEQTTAAALIVYIVSFVLFVPLALLVAVIHIFSLNALILQGASLLDAVRRSYVLIKKNWLVIIETAALQAVLSVGIWILFVIVALFAMIPLFVITLVAAFTQSVGLFSISLIVASIVFICGAVIAAAFTVQLQYATWTILYRRLGEGGVVPKLHRLFRDATGFFAIKS